MKDDAFLNELKKIRPDWFKRIYNKKQLMDLAKNGSPRPKKSEALNSKLAFYLVKHDKIGYDVNFSKQIRNIRPDWFKN